MSTQSDRNVVLTAKTILSIDLLAVPMAIAELLSVAPPKGDGDLVVAATEGLDIGVAVFTQARTILATFASALDDAAKTHAHAQDPLQRAVSAAESLDLLTAQSLGFTAADMLLSAIDTADEASRTAARDLNTLAAGEARD